MNLQFFIDIFLHMDRYLAPLFYQHEVLAIGLVFIVLFCETGLVITPFLPGDSLLFAIGALVALANPAVFPLVLILFYAAAIAGDTLNYFIGHMLRDKVAMRQKIPFVKTEHIDRTHRFFERHGGKTIIIARFIPIIRTFAPFVAGVGNMSYKRFLSFNVIGGISWVTLFLSIGYFFGNLPFIKSHFSMVVIAIIFISVLPVSYTAMVSKMKKKAI